MNRAGPTSLAALAVALLAASVLLFSPSAPLAQENGTTIPAQSSRPGYVGSQACQKCHAEQWDNWDRNPHHNAQVDGHSSGKAVACESCHGPGSLHVAADGDEDDARFATILSFTKAKPEESSAACASCHRTSEQMHWEMSAHARNDVTCADCHSVHEPKDPGGQSLLSAANATQQCVKCHHEKRSELAHTAHMPVREGSMTCADCHNPHGSPGPHMIRAASNNELCTSCHMDKRGPMLWEHPPVRENCVSCHMPHGSNNDKVLASKRPFLCQRCHIATRHPSTLYDRPDLASNRLFNRSCTNCHSQIHGSNHPSGKTFLR